MNLLEQYIKKIHKEEEITINGTKYIEVTIDVNCYGSITKNTKNIFTPDKWEEVKKQGYYMG